MTGERVGVVNLHGIGHDPFGPANGGRVSVHTLAEPDCMEPDCIQSLLPSSSVSLP